MKGLKKKKKKNDRFPRQSVQLYERCNDNEKRHRDIELAVKNVQPNRELRKTGHLLPKETAIQRRRLQVSPSSCPFLFELILSIELG